MTVRSVFAAALAGLVLTAAVAPAADAATPRRPHRAAMHHAKPMKGMKAASMRRMPMRAGGDAQNADVDRLNDQALARARGGQ